MSIKTAKSEGLFEDPVIVTLWVENEIKIVLYTVIHKLSVTFQDRKLKPENDKFIIKMKETLKDNSNKNMHNTNGNHFSLFDNGLMYA